MKTLLSLEEMAMTILAIFLTAHLNMQVNWWIYAALFLTPDIGMLGYMINTTVGAFTYNLLHHRGIAIAFYFIGFATGNVYLQYAGLLLFAHSSVDRILGYGLKYNDAFKHTHLGWLGKTMSGSESE